MRNKWGKNSHRGGVNSGGHENSMRSSIIRLRKKVMEWGDEGDKDIESHCSGCDFN